MSAERQDDQQELVLACGPTTEYQHTPCVERTCAECGVAVWASLLSLSHLAATWPDERVVILCVGCAVLASMLDDDSEWVTPS